ncbi:transmembrane protein 65-like isoform X2 [Pomacea canaliculata]|nr:transmembrane protein 65-like isoform X2 [Pomacea canaliculata]
MAFSSRWICSQCLRTKIGFYPLPHVKKPRQFHVAASNLAQKHTWMPHDQVPNKYVTMYRDIHGPSLHDDEAAREFVFALNSKEREHLLAQLQTFAIAQSTDSTGSPTSEQLRLVALHQALPFIGFGFLDNLIMIIAGEYIDAKLGAVLGISTMAAAGLGNLISDVAGVGSAHYIERFVGWFGVKTPHLTPQQVDLKWTRWASSLGKMIGVTIGCLLGMFPLLFFNNNEKEDLSTPEASVQEDTNPRI